MKDFKLAAIVLLLLALALASRVAQAAESYDNCTGFITSIPTVITTQGTWCLKQDLATAMTSGNAIAINTNSVTIDCNNFKLGGLAAGTGTFTLGIYALDRQNATVRHCNVRGFQVGVDLGGSSSGGHLVEDNRFDGNTHGGIYIEGDGSTVQRNRVFDTGQTTLTGTVYGIVVHGNVDVLGNTVSGVVARAGSNGFAYGIETYLNTANSVNGNRVNGLLADGTGAPLAIANFSSSNLAIRDNDLLGSGIVGSYGITCASANGSAKNNVISGFTTSIDTCSDDGGNSIHP